MLHKNRSMAGRGFFLPIHYSNQDKQILLLNYLRFKVFFLLYTRTSRVWTNIVKHQTPPKFPPIFLRYIYRFSFGDHYTRHRHRRAGENTKICFLHVFFFVCFYLFNSYSAAMNRVSFVVLLFIACTNAYYVTIDAHAEEW